MLPGLSWLWSGPWACQHRSVIPSCLPREAQAGFGPLFRSQGYQFLHSSETILQSAARPFSSLLEDVKQTFVYVHGRHHWKPTLGVTIRSFSSSDVQSLCDTIMVSHTLGFSQNYIAPFSHNSVSIFGLTFSCFYLSLHSLWSSSSGESLNQQQTSLSQLSLFLHTIHLLRKNEIFIIRYPFKTTFIEFLLKIIL